MKLKRKTSFIRPSLELTPLIDVIFLLLIFFMLSSSIVMQTGIRINLPRTTQNNMLAINRVEIKITADDTIFVNNKEVELKELEDILKHMDLKNKIVMIKGDRDASLGRVISVWDVCKRLGIEKLSIAAETRFPYLEK